MTAHTQETGVDIGSEQLSELTSQDIETMIDVVYKLQHMDSDSLALQLLIKIETLLGIHDSALGVFNRECNRHEYVVSTMPKEHIPDIGAISYSTVDTLPFFYSLQDTCIVIVENRDRTEMNFLCLYSSRQALQERHKKIIKHIFPHIVLGISRLNHISSQFLESGLTTREQEVLQWIIKGKDNWTISKILGVSERTVKFHISNIYKKIGVSSKAEAICKHHSFMDSLHAGSAA